MSRKILVPIILIVCFSLFSIGAGTNPALLTKSYAADHYDVTITIQPNNTLIVTETIAFHFTGGPFTYTFRDLEYTNLDEIDRLQASMDGQALLQGTQAGQVEIAVGKPLKVTWHFAPTSDSTHEFTLTYRVQGAIRQNAAADSLIWRAIPETHDYTIAHSTIRIEYLSDLMPLDAPTLDGVPAELEAGERAAVFTTQQIDEDTPVDVSVHFLAGSLISQPPAWQVQQSQTDRKIASALPFGLGAAVLVGLIGLIGVGLMGQSFRREGDPGDASTQTFSVPPRPIPPAVAARLTGSSTTFLGTFFDLARRGLLRIEEGPKKWGSRTFEVLRLPSNERLQDHEQIFVEAFFRKAKSDRVALSEIASLAYNNQFTQALDQELTAAGWRDAKRSAQRTRFLAFSGLGMLFSGGALLVGFLLAVIGASPWALPAAAVLIGGSVGLGGAGLISLLVAAFISTFSEEGVRQATAWKSFVNHLRDIARGREPVTSPDLFERYLPYAAGFGIATQWAKFFQKMTGVPVPAWFHGLQTGLEDGSFVAIMAAISAADTSASVATSGGAGASGGGASGAG